MLLRFQEQTRTTHPVFTGQGISQLLKNRSYPILILIKYLSFSSTTPNKQSLTTSVSIREAKATLPNPTKGVTLKTERKCRERQKTKNKRS